MRTGLDMRVYAVPNPQTAMIGRRLRTLHVVVRSDNGYPLPGVPTMFFTFDPLEQGGIFLRREWQTDNRGVARADFLPTRLGPLVIHCLIGVERNRFTWFDIDVLP